MGGWDGTGWEYDVTPSGAHRDLLPLILPLLPSSTSTPLSPADVPSLPASKPPATAGWPVAMTIIPERKKRAKMECQTEKGRFSIN